MPLSCSAGPIGLEFFRKRDASIGQSDRATMDDIVTDIASTKPNSRNSPPALPGRNDKGMNTAANTAVVVMTAKKTCRVPRTAAARGFKPAFLCLTIFSRTTMASSTTIPVASRSASSVRMLIEKPASQIPATVPISATGIVIAGMRVARQLSKKMKMMVITMLMASVKENNTSLMDPLMNTASSLVTCISMSAGSVGRS